MRTITLMLAMIGLLCSSVTLQAQTQTPSDFLGYELGEAFTPHHKVADYVRHVARSSDRVMAKMMGTSYGGRPLIQLTVSLPEHLDKIEAIRLNNLKRTGLESGTPDQTLPAVVWLSYNVHGNEAVSTEAAMKTLYTLAVSNDQSIIDHLSNTVVIIDPNLNPDGRDRYVNWYHQTKGRFVNVHEDAREHHMPWPGGRTNYYYFDMNRDWAWQTQKESQIRTQAYQQWMPQVHVDFHEQGFNSPYYFAPAAKPFHLLISDWQRDFQYLIGENHAAYFDQNDWLYFTREVFDLFYPSYGDTWPTFNGAIGMTYEQAGIRAGLGIITETGDTLTLKDRIEHHHTTGLSTVETASKNHQRLVKEFTSYFTSAREKGQGDYRAYVIKKDNDPDKLLAIGTYLQDQNIQIYEASEEDEVVGRSYHSETNMEIDIEKGDWVIPSKQPMSILAHVLFEPNPTLTDSVTYDITAWALPYVYGLDAYAVSEDVYIQDEPVNIRKVAPRNEVTSTSKAYGYISNYTSFGDVKFLAALMNKNIKVRTSFNSQRVDGKYFPHGALIITEGDNKHIDNLSAQLLILADLHEQDLTKLDSGYLPNGTDVGSGSVRYLQKPRIAVMSGDGTDANSVGEVWHYFDHQIEYPVTLLDNQQLQNVNWYDYEVLILPEGNYGEVLSSARLESLKSWISDGGKLIAVQSAIRSVVNAGGIGSLKLKEQSLDGKPNLTRYEDSQRESISSYTPGSIFKVTVDSSHPLGFGLTGNYYTLKLSTTSYDYLNNGWNVGRLTSDNHVSGFIGYKARQEIDETVVFATESHGQGDIVYLADNPLFRAFWYNGKHLFGNAVFMVGQ